MNFTQLVFSTVICVLLGIQITSHAQYYHTSKSNDDYDFDYLTEDDLSASGTSDYHSTKIRNIDESSSSYRDRNYRYNPHQFSRAALLGNAVPSEKSQVITASSTSTTTDADSSGASSSEAEVEVVADSQKPSASLALYRIKYNPTASPSPESSSETDSETEYSPPNTFFRKITPSPPYQPAPPPPGPPSPPPQRGFGIFFNDDGQTSIYIPNPEQPDRHEVFHINRNNQPRPPPPNPTFSAVGGPRPSSSRPTFENDRKREREEAEEDERERNNGRPPYAFVVIMDNRPRHLCHDESYRYYQQTGRCYRPGTGQSPCGPLMLFYPVDENTIYGDCDCVRDNGRVSRPLAYWRPHDRCYLLYQRGPCRYNEWLIMNKTGFPLCAPRSCPQSYDGDDENSQEFWFLHRGRCYKTGEYYPSFCPVGEEDRRVYFPLGSNKPSCLTAPPNPRNRTLLTPVVPLRCKKGYKKMQNGECKRTVRFDYDDYDY